MRCIILALAAVLPLAAWGDQGHRAVNLLALTGLPPEVRSWYAGRESHLADHASDPDHWRRDRKEGPRHYMNLEAFGGPGRIPRTLEGARRAAGPDFTRRGVVPWVIQDRWRELAEAFRSRDAARVAEVTAILGHYVADAHVPLHTTLDHDGRTPEQAGVHSRWETGLVGRTLNPATLAIGPARPDPALVDRPFAWLEQAHALVPRLLADDAAADRTSPRRTRGKGRGPAYWALFAEAQGPVVRRQLEAAGQHLADAILNAWIAAGRPRP